MPIARSLSWSEDEVDVVAETVDGSSVFENEDDRQNARDLDLSLLFPECVLARPERENDAGSSIAGSSILQASPAAEEQTAAAVVPLLSAASLAGACRQEKVDSTSIDGMSGNGRASLANAERREQSSQPAMQHEHRKQLNEELIAQRQHMEAQLAANAGKVLSLVDDRVATAVRDMNVLIGQRTEAVEGHANQVFATVQQLLDSFATKLELLIARQSADQQAAREEIEQHLKLNLDDLRGKFTASEDHILEMSKKLEKALASVEHRHLSLEQWVGIVDTRICSDTERRLAEIEERFQAECGKLEERLQDHVQRIDAQEREQENRMLEKSADFETKYEQELKDLEHKLRSDLTATVADSLGELSQTAEKLKTQLQDVEPRLHGCGEEAESTSIRPPAQARTQHPRPQSARMTSSCQPHQAMPRRPSRPSSAKPEYGRNVQSAKGIAGINTAIADDRLECCDKKMAWACSYEIQDPSRPTGAANDDPARLNARKLIAESVAMQMELNGNAPAGSAMLAARTMRP